MKGMARLVTGIVESRGREAAGVDVTRWPPGQVRWETVDRMGGFTNKLGVAGELLGFLWAQKLWWMIPLVVMLLLLAALIAFASATSLGPFIYPLI
jgi:uncharacterized protein DUF5989